MPLGASGSQVKTLPNYHAGEYQATEVPTKIIVPNLQYPLHDCIGPVLFDDGQNFLHPDVNYGAYARPLAVPSCGPFINNLFDMPIPNPNLYIAFDIPGSMAFDVTGNMASDILGNTAYDNVDATSFPVQRSAIPATTSSRPQPRSRTRLWATRIPSLVALISLPVKPL
jgi:hypothetical protein